MTTRVFIHTETDETFISVRGGYLEVSDYFDEGGHVERFDLSVMRPATEAEQDEVFQTYGAIRRF